MPATTKPSSKWPNILIGLAAFIVITPFFNYFLMTKSISTGDAELLAKNADLKARIRKMEALAPTSHEKKHLFLPSSVDNDSPSASSPLLIKANSINSYWWPSAEEGGGLLGKIHAAQNPADCSSPSTKFFVWRSKQDNEKDTRGLTAWVSTFHSRITDYLFEDA